MVSQLWRLEIQDYGVEAELVPSKRESVPWVPPAFCGLLAIFGFLGLVEASL